MSTIGILRDISIALNDSQLGFAEASERVTDLTLKELLLKIGNSRAPMIEEVANELAKLGEGTPEEGTLGGTMHRAWIGLQEMINGRSDPAVLAECEKAERSLLDQYDRGITSDDISQPVKAMFNEHRRLVEKDVESIRTLEKSIQQ